MRHPILPSLSLALMLSLLPSGGHSAPTPLDSTKDEAIKVVPTPEDQGKKRLVILHRCLLECDWAKPMCEQFEGKDCPDKHKTCIARCRDEQAIKAALATQPAATWGTIKPEAIEVCLPSGEHQFIRDLRCPDGTPPRYERVGSVGSRNPPPEGQQLELMPDATRPLKEGELDTHVVDQYRLNCGKKEIILFFDMYHCTGPKPWAAPKGFSRPLP